SFQGKPSQSEHATAQCRCEPDEKVALEPYDGARPCPEHERLGADRRLGSFSIFCCGRSLDRDILHLLLLPRGRLVQTGIAVSTIRPAETNDLLRSGAEAQFGSRE